MAFCQDYFKTNNEIMGKAFYLSKDNYLIGFIDIGSFNEDEKCVYMRGAINKNRRGSNYGHLMLQEISNYIFLNYPKVKYIKLRIDEDNKLSIKTAESYNFINTLDGYYVKSNPYIKQSHI